MSTEETLTVEEREWLATEPEPTPKLLRLYDAALSRAEAAEQGEKDAVKACDDNWVTHQRVVAAEKAQSVAAQFNRTLLESRNAVESRLAEATALLARIESELETALGWTRQMQNQNASMFVSAALRLVRSFAAPAQAAGLDTKGESDEAIDKVCMVRPVDRRVLGPQNADALRVPVALPVANGALAPRCYCLKSEESDCPTKAAGRCPAQAAEPGPVPKADQDRSVPRAEIERAIARGMRDSRIVAGDPVLPEHPDTIALRECRAELERADREKCADMCEASRLRTALESARAERDTALRDIKDYLANIARLEEENERWASELHDTGKTLKDIAAARDTARGLHIAAEKYGLTQDAALRTALARITALELEAQCNTWAATVAEKNRRLGNLADSHDLPRVRDVAGIHSLKTRIARAVAELKKLKRDAVIRQQAWAVQRADAALKALR